MMPVPVSAQVVVLDQQARREDDVHAVATVVETIAGDAVVGGIGEGQVARTA
jgi:hypothetical protein